MSRRTYYVTTNYERAGLRNLYLKKGNETKTKVTEKELVAEREREKKC